jgi:hypothetical protein
MIFIHSIELSTSRHKLNLRKEIGHELYRYVKLVDPAFKQFEVVVDKKIGSCVLLMV